MSVKSYTNRREVLAGLGGLAAGAFLAPGRIEAGSLEPPGPPEMTMLPLSDIEPRTAINEVNTPGNELAMHVISAPGSYYLTENVAIPAGKIGILIDADDVTLDLMGFMIRGTSDQQSVGGIRSGVGGRKRIVVRNGGIARAGSFAIDLAHDGGRLSRVQDIRTSLSTAGILVGEGSLVLSCVVLEAGDPGIGAGNESIISQCRVHVHNARTRAITVGIEASVSDCVVIGPFAQGIEGAESSIIRKCQVVSSTASAYSTDDGSLVTSCLAGNCSGDGLHMTTESLSRGNCLMLSGGAVDTAALRLLGWRNVVSDGDMLVPNVPDKALARIDGHLNLVVRNSLRAIETIPFIAPAGNAWSIVSQVDSASGGNNGGSELPTGNPDANIRV